MVGFCLESLSQAVVPKKPCGCPELRAHSTADSLLWKVFPINYVWYLKSGGELSVTPLAIYSFPCNGIETSLATCPESLTVSLPLFSTDKISFVRWDLGSDDMSSLELHHASENSACNCEKSHSDQRS